VPIQSQKLAYSFTEKYDIDNPTSLKISSSNSNITIFSHSSNTIEILYLVKKNEKLLSVNKSTLKDLIKTQSNLNIIHTANEMKIEVTNIIQNDYIKLEDTIIIDFVLYVPKQTSCELESSDGSISLNGLDSNQKCITSDGNIELSNLNGDVIAKTSDGDIIINNVTGKVDSKTNDGKIIKK
jgi:hypothetical protein